MSIPAPVAFWPKSGIVAMSATARIAGTRPAISRVNQYSSPRRAPAQATFRANMFASRKPVKSWRSETRNGKK